MVSLAGCVQSAASSTTDVAKPDAVVVADHNRWETKAIKLPVGQDVVVLLDNRDTGIAHNIRFKTAPGDPKTTLKMGPLRQTLKARFDEPGEYKYTCDLHPLMVGVATVG